ncbi:unnamed protein product, partial [Heterotrigona itama]
DVFVSCEGNLRQSMPDDSPTDGSTENPSIPFDPRIRIPFGKTTWGFRKTEP